MSQYVREFAPNLPQPTAVGPGRPAQRKRNLRWPHWLCLFYVLQALGAFGVLDRLVYGEWDGKPGDLLTQTLNLTFFASSILLFISGYNRLKRVETGGLLAIGLTLLMFASAFWSFDPRLSIREAIIYLSAVLGSIGIAANLEGDDFMDMLAVACFWSALASVLLWLTSPANAMAGEDFRGIFSQKNVLGQAMAIGAIGCLHRLRIGRAKRISSLLMLAAVSAVAVASKSATSCLTIVLCCGTDMFLSLSAKGGAGRALSLMAALLVLPAIIYVAISPDSLLEMLGKDPTLTGRTEIWAYVLADIQQRPLLGWGYSAFWSLSNPAAFEIDDAVRWVVPQAHNGMLEILLNLGYVGAAYFAFVLLRNFFLGFRCLGIPQRALGVSSLLACASIVVVGVSEAVLIYSEASTSVFFITGLLCERAIRTSPYLYRNYSNLTAFSPPEDAL